MRTRTSASALTGGLLALLLGLTGGAAARADSPDAPPQPNPTLAISGLVTLPGLDAASADGAAAPAGAGAAAEDGVCRLPGDASAAVAGAPESEAVGTAPWVATPPLPGAPGRTPAAPPGGAGAAGDAPAAASPGVPAAPLPMPSLAFDAGCSVPPTRYGKLIYQIASRYALNPLLVAAMVEVESAFNPHAHSRKGAYGLMQLLPATARRFGVPRRRDLLNPKKNLEVGSRYLRWLIDRFGADPVRVLAAYNAGEGAVDRFGGVPPFAETRDYVTRIFAELGFSVLLDTPISTLDTTTGTK